MEDVEWMWDALSRMEQDAKSLDWPEMIDQINIARKALTAEASRLLATETSNIVHVDFMRRRQVHCLEALRL